MLAAWLLICSGALWGLLGAFIEKDVDPDNIPSEPPVDLFIILGGLVGLVFAIIQAITGLPDTEPGLLIEGMAWWHGFANWAIGFSVPIGLALAWTWAPRGWQFVSAWVKRELAAIDALDAETRKRLAAQAEQQARELARTPVAVIAQCKALEGTPFPDTRNE